MSSYDKTSPAEIDRSRTHDVEADAHLDPLTKEPGAHPVGVGVGAALGGAAAGAATGTIAGPVGTVIGAAVGAIVGGLAGKGVAESIDPTVESAYWRDNYRTRPYVTDASTYDDFGPAYDQGVQAYRSNPERSYDEVEPELERGWHTTRGTSRLEWDQAKQASRDAWHRLSDKVERAVPGDSDRDGK